MTPGANVIGMHAALLNLGTVFGVVGLMVVMVEA